MTRRTNPKTLAHRVLPLLVVFYVKLMDDQFMLSPMSQALTDSSFSQCPGEAENKKISDVSHLTH